ncbi:MAG: hydrogenase subunit MbhD domain-containing protein [Patescibacteria group bacterium]|nr:hydrogenase subunit MbhD domain-containing protein [Patescibacteria group bacterium]
MYLINEIIQALVLIAIVISAFLAMRSKDLFISIIYLALMSLMLAVEFYILQAPDVAIAEAVAKTGLSTAIFVIAIYKIRKMEDKNSDTLNK